MKKVSKALVALVLIISVFMVPTAFAAEKYEAVEPKFGVLVDDVRFYSFPPIVVIDGRTYLPLRALGECLGIYIGWNGDLGQVEVSTTKEAEPIVYTESPYSRYKDVPNFRKITGIKLYGSREDKTDLGYTVTYGYQTPAEGLDKAMEAYINELTNCGYNLYFEEETDTAHVSLYFKKDTGRMLKIHIDNEGVAITIVEKPYSEEDWKIVDSGKTVPQKKFDAVTAGFKVMVDGNEFVSENPAMVINDRTYLPLRAMGDVLGVFVDWDAVNQTVIVKSKK